MKTKSSLREKAVNARRSHFEPAFDGIIGQSPVLKAVGTLAREMAVSDAPVLILGETGSGEESIARASSHQRKKEP